jgi:hypothetical protein
MRELARDLRRRDREKLRDLRRKIVHARKEKKHALATVRQHCADSRSAVRDRQRAERMTLRDVQRLERITGRGSCSRNRDEARAIGLSAIGLLKHELHDERSLQRAVRNADKPARMRATKGERREESDDEVRRDLAPELVPVFNAVRKTIKGSARRTRTEAFLEWAHDNPGEVLQLQQHKADRELEALLATEAEHYKAIRKASRYKQAPAALRRALAEVPF